MQNRLSDLISGLSAISDLTQIWAQGSDDRATASSEAPQPGDGGMGGGDSAPEFGWVKPESEDGRAGHDSLPALFQSKIAIPGEADQGWTGRVASDWPAFTPETQSVAAAARDLTDRQWHLDNTGQVDGIVGIDLNMKNLWRDYDGSGVTIGIWDDGIDYNHADLAAAYDTSLHVRAKGEVHDPLARTSVSEHGTAVAGIIAADRDGDGVTGIAHGARIAGVDILSDIGIKTDFGPLKDFDVTNHSWGYDPGYALGVTSPKWTSRFADLDKSSVSGRDGLGTINVFAAGNDREKDRNTNDSGLTSLSHTIAVAAVSHDGMIADYSTPGATLLVAAPSSGYVNGVWTGIWTTDRTGEDGYSSGRETGTDSADHTNAFGGTSAAAPMVSGVVALMLEANPGLGWRDVQEILAHTARHVGSDVGRRVSGYEEFGWNFNAAKTWNGGGLHHSNDYGFGLVDAWAAVRLAENWTSVQNQDNRREVEEATSLKSGLLSFGRPISVDLTVRAKSDVETIGIDVDFLRGGMEGYTITLTSPSGTVSTLSTPSDTGKPVTDWYFASKAFWGEQSVGTWTVTITGDMFNASIASLNSVALTTLGGVDSPDDIHVFTNEFSDYVGQGYGHSKRISDRNGGQDTLNMSAVSAASRIDLARGDGRIDGVDVMISGRFERVVGGDRGDIFKGKAIGEDLRGVRGDDVLVGRGGKDTLSGGEGRDVLKGGSGRDTLSGGAGRDLLKGGKDADKLYGGAGNDRINGEAGRDILVDGAGADRLTGGGGRDIFRFATDGETDRILDFTDGSDRQDRAAGGIDEGSGHQEQTRRRGPDRS